MSCPRLSTRCRTATRTLAPSWYHSRRVFRFPTAADVTWASAEVDALEPLCAGAPSSCTAFAVMPPKRSDYRRHGRAGPRRQPRSGTRRPSTALIRVHFVSACTQAGRHAAIIFACGEPRGWPPVPSASLSRRLGAAMTSAEKFPRSEPRCRETPNGSTAPHLAHRVVCATVGFGTIAADCSARHDPPAQAAGCSLSPPHTRAFRPARRRRVGTRQSRAWRPPALPAGAPEACRRAPARRRVATRVPAGCARAQSERASKNPHSNQAPSRTTIGTCLFSLESPAMTLPLMSSRPAVPCCPTRQPTRSSTSGSVLVASNR